MAWMSPGFDSPWVHIITSLKYAMKFFSSLKRSAINFLEPYKTKGPATYAAAQQAVGGLLILDGFVGIENPFDQHKRPGIFGSLAGIAFGLIFVFISTLFGGFAGVDKMTEQTPATVISVQANADSSACSAQVRYVVAGREYKQNSPYNSSGYCSLVPGSTIQINYDPDMPGNWGYNPKTIINFLRIFQVAGILVIVSSFITFIIRLLSIYFGWKLLKAGRRNAADLPAGTNLQTIIDEVKQNFTTAIFGKIH